MHAVELEQLTMAHVRSRRSTGQMASGPRLMSTPYLAVIQSVNGAVHSEPIYDWMVRKIVASQSIKV